VRSLTATIDSATAVEVLTTYDTTRSGTKDDSGRVIFSGSGRVGVTALFNVRQVGGRWLVADIVSIKQGRRA
jgi:hypothetical protein